MYELSDFKKGLKIMVEGNPMVVTDFQHVKPGKGNQFTRTKMRNLLTGTNLEKTFKQGERFEVPNVTNRDMNYLYKDDNGYNFMDKETFEQITMTEAEIGSAKYYLTENLEVTILTYNDRPVLCDVPNAVNLKVTRTDPGMRGDTVTGATKPAILETGLSVKVPLHINEGDVLRVDTDSGNYIERVNK